MLNRDEVLYLDLATSENTVSSVLIEEPVYIVSSTLHDVETRYPLVEKLGLAIVFTSRRLRPYF